MSQNSTLSKKEVKYIKETKIQKEVKHIKETSQMALKWA
jgi:hypothetical protein